MSGSSASIKSGQRKCYLAYLIKDKRRNPDTGQTETRYRIGELTEGRQVSGQIGFVTEKEAKRLLTIYEGRRAAGETPEAIWQRALTPISEAAQKPPELTVQSLYDRYALSLAASGAAPATLESARYAWLAWSVEIGTITPHELTTAKIDTIVLSWRQAGKSDRTIQIRSLLLKRVLALALDERSISSSPKIKIPPLREVRPHKWLSPEEQVKVLDAIDWTRPSAWSIYLCLQLGMRTGEAHTRTWGDIDWHAAQVRVGSDGQGWHTKTRTNRFLPLAPPVLMRLKEGYLMAGRDNSALICRGVEDIRRALSGACKRAKVPDIHPHALRHSWASRLATAGVDRPTLMALGGWTSGELLDEVYAHAHTSHIRAQVDRTALENSTQTSLPNVRGSKFGNG